MAALASDVVIDPGQRIEVVAAEITAGMTQGSAEARSTLSARGQRCLAPALSYGKAFGQAAARPWSEKDPGGNIVCMVAENKLTADVLHAKMNQVQADVPVSTMSYPAGFKGFPAARQAMAQMMRNTFMKGVDVDPDHIALLSGAGAVLEVLFWTLCNAGDAVLLPTPIYPAFLNDMEVRGGCHAALFPLEEGEPGSVREQLTKAAAAAAAEGHPPRVLLLTNPNNPLGTIYKEQTVLEALLWCLDNNVHLISDEIYANSVWGEGGPAFISAEALARRQVADEGITPHQAEALPQLLHTVFGLSKDFCASGLRVGALHSRNALVLQAVTNLAYFHGCSTPTLWTLTQVLSDDEFVRHFVKTNNERMRAAYEGLSGALTAAGIPHTKATAAMFCWIDLRAGLLHPGWEGEQELWQAMVDAGVLFTPGEACKASEPGFFRCCWAWVPPAALLVAVDRIAVLLSERKAQHTASAIVDANPAT